MFHLKMYPMQPLARLFDTVIIKHNNTKNFKINKSNLLFSTAK